MRSIYLACALVLALGCSDGSDDDRNGTGGSTSGTGGGGGGGGGGALTGCQALCAHTNTATKSQTDCVAANAYLKGYNWPGDPICSTIATESMCNTCTHNIAITDADCSALESQCF
jgi:hypothetical protein